MSVRVAFESFGVALAVDVDGPASGRLLDAVTGLLPPGHRPMPSTAPPDLVLGLSFAEGRWVVRGADHPRLECTDETDALHALDREIRAAVSLHAPDLVFVHAGVVAGRRGACVIPGRSFAGKTTLVAALVEAGATYLSDEYAVLDRSGAVLPYARPLSFRTTAGRLDVAAADLGAVAEPVPWPVALVVSTSYDPATTWRPEIGSAGDGALALVANAVAARVRPGEVLAAAAAVARSAQHLHGARGDAAAAAGVILDLLGGPCPPDLPDPPDRTAAPGVIPTPARLRAPAMEGQR